jgi:ABC-type antimicrobial peptide transport system permease subunit
MRLVVLGVIIGVPLALFAARGLRHQLYGIGPADPLALTVALVVLLGCGVLAALIPALRASRVAPVLALREE